MEKLLQEVNNIIRENDRRQDLAYKNGESFNLISVMQMEWDETKTHSRILADLLNPNGSHGQGSIFLEKFLCLSESLQELDLELSKVHVIVEKNIGKIDSHYQHGGRIDIVIEAGDKAIIIENKINAPDQKNQLLRYQRYADQTYRDGYRIIYLNKFGTPASDYSTGNKLSDDDYLQLGYSTDILNWLEVCQSYSKDKPRIFDVLEQYKEAINLITDHSMDDISLEQLLNLLTKKENIWATSQILLNENAILNSALSQYVWNPIKEWAESKGYMFVADDEGCQVYTPEWKEHSLYLTTDRKIWDDLYIGVYHYADTKPLPKKNRFQLDFFDEKPLELWPLGWKYLPEQIRSFGFHNMQSIVNGDVVTYFIGSFNEVLRELESHHIDL